MKTSHGGSQLKGSARLLAERHARSWSVFGYSKQDAGCQLPVYVGRAAHYYRFGWHPEAALA